MHEDDDDAHDEDDDGAPTRSDGGLMADDLTRVQRVRAGAS